MVNMDETISNPNPQKASKEELLEKQKILKEKLLKQRVEREKLKHELLNETEISKKQKLKEPSIVKSWWEMFSETFGGFIFQVILWFVVAGILFGIGWVVVKLLKLIFGVDIEYPPSVP